MNDLPSFLAYRLFDNSVYDYTNALLVFAIGIIFLRIFRYVVVRKLKRYAEKTDNDFDNAIVNSVATFSWMFSILISAYAGLQVLILHPTAEKVIDVFVLIIVSFYVIRALQVFFDYGVQRAMEDKDGLAKHYSKTAMKLMEKLMLGALWGVAIILILQNAGLDVTALVTGLGITGIAIAFALQNVLSDIFATFAISLDRPFEVGDFIKAGKDSGKVRKIGIKSTRIASLEGHEIVISNKDLTESRISNFGSLKRRRVLFYLLLTYDTPQSKLKKIPKIIEEVVEKHENYEFSRAKFDSFGDSGLKYEVVYYVGSGSYSDYMDAKDAINLAIKGAFEKEGIRFAYPTQTIHVENGSK